MIQPPCCLLFGRVHATLPTHIIGFLLIFSIIGLIVTLPPMGWNHLIQSEVIFADVLEKELSGQFQFIATTREEQSDD